MEEEAIKMKFKESMEPTDNTKNDPLSFLNSREEEIKYVLQSELTRRKRKQIYFSVPICNTKSKRNCVEVVEPHFHLGCRILFSVR